MTAAAELEGAKACQSEFSELLLLSTIFGLEVEARRVGVSLLGGVEFSLVGALNHELPQEGKPAAIRKQSRIKHQQESADQKLQL